jgi:hypothetical protein
VTMLASIVTDFLSPTLTVRVKSFGRPRTGGDSRAGHPGMTRFDNSTPGGNASGGPGGSEFDRPSPGGDS